MDYHGNKLDTVPRKSDTDSAITDHTAFSELESAVLVVLIAGMPCSAVPIPFYNWILGYWAAINSRVWFSLKLIRFSK